jgi:UDP-N-acetylmuramoyl-L-alanyl-D-glutamate--2,6-diaminopimelate ligase
MGEVATRLANRAYVTDDNPRTEPASEIRRTILAAASGAIEIGDRREAIATAIAELAPGDLLVIAGKGHETSQIVGTETYPFDDVEIAREFARARWGSAGG